MASNFTPAYFLFRLISYVLVFQRNCTLRHHSYFRNDFQKLLAVYIGHVQFPHCALAQMSHVMRNLLFTDGKIKVQISCTETTQLISAFVIPTSIEQSLYSSNPKLQAFSHLQWPYSQVYGGPGWKPKRQVFSRRDSVLC